MNFTGPAFAAAAASFLVLAGCATPSRETGRFILRPENPEERTDIRIYSAPSEFQKQIKAKRVSLTPAQMGRLNQMTKDAAVGHWTVEDKPSMNDSSPFDSSLYVFWDDEPGRCVRLDFLQNINVEHEWVNSKLLWTRAWWGRVAYTESILDTESCKFIYMEDGWEGDAMLPDTTTNGVTP